MPNVLNYILDIFFADHIVLLRCKYKCIKVVEVIQTIRLNSSMGIHMSTMAGSTSVP